MGVKTYSDSNAATKYNFLRIAGRSLIDRCPIFSPDGESLLVIVEDLVRVYNIQTGDCARTLETEIGVKELVAIQFPENENYNLCGCSDQGCITTWTWENGVVLREVNLNIPIGLKVLSFNLVDNNDCFITAVKPNNNKFIFYGLYSVKTGTRIFELSDTKFFYYENMIHVAIGWCNGDRFAAICNGTPKLIIQNLSKHHVRNQITSSNNIRFLSVTAHKTDNVLATIDALGRASIYKGDFFQYTSPLAREELHWHSLPAMSVCFSVQGNYIYTGGMEKVLVKWTVGHISSRANEKTFIPRLPGMIRHIATNNAHVAVSLTNNSIVIAHAQMRVVSTIMECGGLSPVARALGFPLLYHQRLDGLLLGGRTGHLQLYSTATDKVLTNMDITGLNTTSPLRYNLLPLETEVTVAAISGNGSCLVTSEYRNDGITYPEERLKFWSLQIKNPTPFKLNTCVNLSHGGCRVISIALSLRAEFCVSAGADQKLRIWKKESTSRKKEYWTCLTACYYSSGVSQFLEHGILNKYKSCGLPPTDKEHSYVYEFDMKNDIIQKIANIHKEHGLVDEKAVNIGFTKNDENDVGGVAISQDGSLMAAWFGSKLTLWDTHLCNLRTTLSHPALRPKGKFVEFGHRDAAHFLVCTTEKCVAVWSLLSLTVKWLVQINATCLTSDPLSNKMALTTSNNDLYVFTPHSSTPILTQKRLVDPSTGIFKQCTFGTCTGDDIRLYAVRNDSEIYCLEPKKSEEGRLEVISRRNMPASNFSALLAEQQLSEVQPAAGGALMELNSAALANSAISQFLSAAPHMVPPVSLLCTSFLHHISGHEEKELDTQEDQVEAEQPSSDDEDPQVKQNGSHVPKPAQLWAPNYERVKEKRLHKILQEPLLDLHATSDIFGV